MKTKHFLIIFSCAILFLLGCNTPLFARPTATPTPTSTITPTPTATFTPTPTNTLTPSPTPRLIMGEVQTADSGDYSFRSPRGFIAVKYANQVSIASQDNTTMMTMIVNYYEENLPTLKANMDDFLAGMSNDFDHLQYTHYSKILVDGIEGLSTEISGFLSEIEFAGKVVIVNVDGSRVFVACGITLLSMDKDLWEKTGRMATDQVMNSIRFLEGIPSTDITNCSISKDPTYGYSMDNPIKVGGDVFGGPSRERAYLDNLLGPKGQLIGYNRLGSTAYGNTILDVYEIYGLNKSITLYIDEYSFEELKAPVGFTCKAAFPLVKP